MDDTGLINFESYLNNGNLESNLINVKIESPSSPTTSTTTTTSNNNNGGGLLQQHLIGHQQQHHHHHNQPTHHTPGTNSTVSSITQSIEDLTSVPVATTLKALQLPTPSEIQNNAAESINQLITQGTQFPSSIYSFYNNQPPSMDSSVCEVTSTVSPSNLINTVHHQLINHHMNGLNNNQLLNNNQNIDTNNNAALLFNTYNNSSNNNNNATQNGTNNQQQSTTTQPQSLINLTNTHNASLNNPSNIGLHNSIQQQYQNLLNQQYLKQQQVLNNINNSLARNMSNNNINNLTSTTTTTTTTNNQNTLNNNNNSTNNNNNSNSYLNNLFTTSPPTPILSNSPALSSTSSTTTPNTTPSLYQELVNDDITSTYLINNPIIRTHPGPVNNNSLQNISIPTLFNQNQTVLLVGDVDIIVEQPPPSDVRTRTPNDRRTFNCVIRVVGDYVKNNVCTVLAQLAYANSHTDRPSQDILGGNKVVPVGKDGKVVFDSLSMTEASTKHQENEFVLEYILLTEDNKRFVLPNGSPFLKRSRPFYAYSNQKVLSRRRNVTLRTLSSNKGSTLGGDQMHVVGSPFIRCNSLRCFFHTPHGHVPANNIELFSESVLFFTLPPYPAPPNFNPPDGTELPVQVVITNDGRNFSNPLPFTYIFEGSSTKRLRSRF